MKFRLRGNLGLAATAFSLMATAHMAYAQSKEQLWKKSSRTGSSHEIKKTDFPLNRLVDLDLDSLKKKLANAPNRNTGITSETVISLPDGDGKMEEFRVYDNPVMAPELAAKYPEIKSYYAVGIDNPHSSAYFSYSPLGFKSMVLNADKSAVFIEPVTDDLNTYTVYKKSDRKKSAEKFECTTPNVTQKK